QLALPRARAAPRRRRRYARRRRRARRVLENRPGRRAGAADDGRAADRRGPGAFALMRISLTGPAPPLRGGVALHTAGLAVALRTRGHDVEVVSYSRLYPRFLFPGTHQREDCAPVGAALLDTLDPRT